VFLAAISPSEIHHAAARALYDTAPEDRPFLVPSLFRTEVLSALARRRESEELLDTVEVLVSGPRFHSVAIDAGLIERAGEVARLARLRAYDAVYAALALERGAAFLTLDVEVRSKLSRAFPELPLIAAAP
jgi:predicted nucleic acid-binding protein